MQITPAAPQTNAPAPVPQGGKPAAINSDFETFLKMLTVQMKNQDPLDPADASDFAVQLATFSAVEQQVRTNDLLTSIGAQLAGMGMGQLQGWIGMTARAEMPVAFDGAPVRLTLNTPTGADLARLVVRDARGGIVQQLDAPASGGDVIWTGQGEDGHPLPHGLYQIEVDAFRGDTHLEARPVESQARIVEARNGPGGTLLIMAGGQEVAADRILGLRAPDAD